jgi:hypothetical protein
MISNRDYFSFVWRRRALDPSKSCTHTKELRTGCQPSANHPVPNADYLLFDDVVLVAQNNRLTDGRLWFANGLGSTIPRVF